MKNTALIAQSAGFYGVCVVVVPFTQWEVLKKLDGLLNFKEFPEGGKFTGIPVEKTGTDTQVWLVPHDGPPLLNPVNWDTGANQNDSEVIAKCLKGLGLIE